MEKVEMLERSEFEEVIDIVVQKTLPRRLLLDRLSDHFVSSLETVPAYNHQIRMDLMTINKTRRLLSASEPPLVTWLKNLEQIIKDHPESQRIKDLCVLVQRRLGDAPAAAPSTPPDTTLPTLGALADALARAWGRAAFPTEKTPRPGWSHIRARTDDSNGAVNFAMGGGPDGCPLETALDGPLREPRSGEAGAYAFFKVRLRPATREARIELHTLIVDYGAGKGSPETRAARLALARRLASAKMPSGWKKGANDGAGSLDKKSGMVWCYENWSDFATLDALAARVRGVVEPARVALIAVAPAT